MTSIFANKKALLLNDNDHSRKLLVAILRMVGFRHIDEHRSSGASFTEFQNHNHDVIVGDIVNGASDVIALCSEVRRSELSPNPYVPVLAIASVNALTLLDKAKEVMVTDLLQSPYSVSNISQKLKYIMSMNAEQIENIRQSYQDEASVDEAKLIEQWPDKEESEELTHTLLDHYIKHYEIVFKKLNIAQQATSKCMETVKSNYGDIKDAGSANYDNFESMWQNILALFSEGSDLSEEAFFEIEKLISKIPEEINVHYKSLSEKDQSLVTLVNSLNTSAYIKAKEKVVTLQAQKNPLNGRSAEDYISVSEDAIDAESVIYHPRKRK